jgi:hypothetical protein
MKKKTKIYFSLILSALFSCIVTLLIILPFSRKELFQTMGIKAQDLALTIAAQVSSSQLKDLDQPQAVQTLEYQQILKQLETVLHAHEQSKSGLLYLYTLTPSADKKRLFYGVDVSSGHSSDFSPPGTPYLEEDASAILLHLNRPFFSKKLITDSHGTYLSAFAPIVDSHNIYVATLGIDLNIDPLFIYDKTIYEYTALALLLSLSLGLIFAHFLLRSKPPGSSENAKQG